MADSTIQRFEFTVELAWKLLKSYLEFKGIPGISTPIDTIKEANLVGLLDDKGDDWIKMLRGRNLTSHTYDAANAEDAYKLVKTSYYPLLLELNSTMIANIS